MNRIDAYAEADQREPALPGKKTPPMQDIPAESSAKKQRSLQEQFSPGCIRPIRIGRNRSTNLNTFLQRELCSLSHIRELKVAGGTQRSKRQQVGNCRGPLAGGVNVWMIQASNYIAIQHAPAQPRPPAILPRRDMIRISISGWIARSMPTTGLHSPLLDPCTGSGTLENHALAFCCPYALECDADYPDLCSWRCPE